MLVNVGTGFTNAMPTLKGIAPDWSTLSPSDSGNLAPTETIAVPVFAIKEAGTLAVTSEALINVVTKGTPFQSTSVDAPEADTKSEPKTVSVKPGPPAVAWFGLIP